MAGGSLAGKLWSLASSSLLHSRLGVSAIASGPASRTWVKFSSATVYRNGFRPARFGSNGPALAKRSGLKFEADTNVPWPYEVYWQVVNTGAEASKANGLRGSFEQAYVGRGSLSKNETTLYSGTHSIECFVVKDAYCVAQSGPFVVNIK